MLSLTLLTLTARAGEPAESRWADSVQPGPAPVGSGFSGVALFQNRYVLSNVVTTNPFLDGQVVGKLGGINSTTVNDGGQDLDGDGEIDEKSGNASYVEQRLGLYFRYAPTIWSDKVALNTAFELDFLWGDQSGNVGGNTGGGFGADQVNIQTRRVNLAAKVLKHGHHEATLVSGLQFVSDGVYDPAKARPDELFRMGGGLRFWGSEAAGLSLYGRYKDDSGERLRYRLGGYTLSEQGVAIHDDTGLLMADVQVSPAYGIRLAGHAWALFDRSGGTGGAFGVGPSSQLSELQGGPSLDLRTAAETPKPLMDADLRWFGADGGYNTALDKGPVGVGALYILNQGTLYAEDVDPVAVLGWLADAELRVRWASGAGSVLRAEVLATSRDGTGATQYTGVVTGNSYGVVGALWGSHGSMLMLPDPWAVNRQTPIVPDVSNAGVGLRAADLSAGWDPIPNKLTVQAGATWAQDGLGEGLGTELNGRVIGHPWFLANLGLGVATVKGSRFDADPWTVIASYDQVFF